jgi:hypothetical protein
MSNPALSLPDASASPPGRTVAVGVLLIWFSLVTWLAAKGAFLGARGAVPVALILAFAMPIAAFLLGYRWSEGMRRFVLGADLRLVVAVHAWRTLGFGFIVLHLNGLLPGIFAWPAGLGDIAVAVAAPWLAVRLMRDPGFAHKPAFARWNWLGLSDFAIAMATGGLGSGLVPALVGQGPTTALMATLPLSWVPTFLVPLMAMLHITALLQARQRT